MTVRENKQFLDRAVNWISAEGIGQFIDVGCGLPTPPSTHGSARIHDKDARVAYVDNDPIVLSHLRGLPGREQADGLDGRGRRRLQRRRGARRG